MTGVQTCALPIYPGAVALDAHLHVVIDDPFDGDQDFHRFLVQLQRVDGALGSSRERIRLD